MKPHYICWDADQTFEVLNPDAEAIDDAVFLAVHSDRPLILMPTARSVGYGEGPGAGSSISGTDLLGRFLDPARKHVQAAVVGGAGTGKSHLIHWMRLHIPPTDDRLVITIPRSGTSLRGILQLLIEQLPAQARDTYNAKLAEAASDNLPAAVRLQALIANVRLALLAMNPAPNDEVEEWLLDDHLALLFQDPFLVRQLSADSGIFAELAEHVGELHRYSRVEAVRAFDFPDFQLVGADVDRLAEPTRAVIPQMLGNARVREAAARLVNDAIPRAISAVLNFTGDELIELMGDVRRNVGSRGQEIVLLIEDFARLQGIDQALLQALLVQHSTEQPDLAPLRWAMAVTRGYWDARVRDTVLERMDLVLDMDSPPERGGKSREEEVKGFSAKYLNAVRVPGEQLRSWRISGAAGHPPNPCEPCPYRAECHQAFGEVDGVGLYPFNTNALIQMLTRKDSRYPAVMNPRSVVGPVLKEVLGNRRQEFDEGIFPSQSFLDGMGGRTGMQAADVRWISDRTGPDADRYIATVSLWGDGARTASPAILATFGLSPIVDAPIPPTTAPTAVPTPVQTRSGLEAALDSWGTGQPLPERYGRQLREYVFDAVTTAIEWDALGLEREAFAKPAGGDYFGHRRISFQNQEVQAEGGPITLVIPDNDGRDEILNASLALHALASLRSTGHLPDANPRMYHLQLSRHIRMWTLQVVDALQKAVGRQGPERARPYARLLLLGAALSGIRRDVDDQSGWVKAVFGDWNSNLNPTPGTWLQSVTEIPVWRPRAVAAYLAVSAAPKGGVARAAIDPRALLLEFAELERAGWRSDGNAARGAADRGPVLERLAEVLRQVSSQANEVVDQEWMRQREWLKRTDKDLPAGTSANETRTRVIRLRSELASSPIAYSRESMESVLRMIDTMSAEDVDRARDAIRNLTSRTEAPGLPELVEPARLDALTAWNRVAASVRDLVSDVTNTIAARGTASDAAAQAAADNEAIKQSLRVIIDAATEIGR